MGGRGGDWQASGWERGITRVVVAPTHTLLSHLRGASVLSSEELARCPHAGRASWTQLLRSFFGLPPAFEEPLALEGPARAQPRTRGVITAPD